MSPPHPAAEEGTALYKEEEHPRDKGGKFTDKMKQLEEKYTAESLGKKRELTKEEK